MAGNKKVALHDPNTDTDAAVTAAGDVQVTLDGEEVDVGSLDHGKTLKSTGGLASSSGDNTLISAVAAKKIKVQAYTLTTLSTTAVICKFTDGAAGTELWRLILQAPTDTSTGANSPAVAIPGHVFETSVNTALVLNLDSAQNIHWSVSYFEEA